MLIFVMLLLVVSGCRGSKKPKEEVKENPNVGKTFVLVLTTGDRIEGKLVKETPEEVTILGKKGEATFPRSMIAGVEEPAPQVEEAPKPRAPRVTLDEDKYPYAAISGKKVFHRKTCVLLQRQKNLVLYSSRQEAIEDGLKPCGTCNP
jgi:hypothetical protein